LALVLIGGCAILATVTATVSNERGFTEKFILRALILSLLVHFLAFFTYKIGESQGWWTNWAMPRWMQVVSRALAPVVPKQATAITPKPVPLMFVEVDPANAIPEPPKTPKFEGAHNTVAANREIVRPSDVPNISGRQDKVLKTTEDAKPKAQPLQTTPPPLPRTVASAAAPKKTYTPGDLASASKPDTGTAIDAQPQAQPVYQRPRTIAEALDRKGTLGEKARLAGGVKHVDMISSLDVKSTAVGDYESNMVEAIKTRWFQLLEKVSANASGKVVLEFKLRPDGRITDMKMAQNEVTEELGTFCEQAIFDPAPFPPWPRQMRLDIPADSLDLQFTFYYDVE
jgi:hypothetical protein